MKNQGLVSLALCAAVLTCPLAFAQDDVRRAMDEAKRQYGNGNYEGAVAELTIVTEEAPDRADAFYLLGYAHLMLRDYPDSLDAFARAFLLDPNLDPRTIYRPGPAE